MPNTAGAFDGSAIGNGTSPVNRCSWKSPFCTRDTIYFYTFIVHCHCLQKSLQHSGMYRLKTWIVRKNDSKVTHNLNSTMFYSNPLKNFGKYVHIFMDTYFFNFFQMFLLYSRWNKHIFACHHRGLSLWRRLDSTWVFSSRSSQTIAMAGGIKTAACCWDGRDAFYPRRIIKFLRSINTHTNTKRISSDLSNLRYLLISKLMPCRNKLPGPTSGFLMKQGWEDKYTTTIN